MKTAGIKGLPGNRQPAVDLLVFQCRVAGLPTPTPEYRFHPTRQWPFDLAFIDARVAVEVDGGVWMKAADGGGGRHSRGPGIETDYEKVAEAMLLGWRVLRVTPGQVKRGIAVLWLERLLKGGIA